MNEKQPHLRQLPPSAVPVTTADLRAGWGATATTHDDFRADLAAYFGLPHNACYLAASGRTALYILLKGLAVDFPARRQVVIPAYTCPVVAKVALDLDLEPVYVDIEPRSTAYKNEQLAAVVGDRTLAILLVHPFGIPLAPDHVLSTARAVGAVVIEDAAQALGARWTTGSVGLAGDFAIFSLGPGKPLSTGGGGIAITGSGDHLEQLTRYWSSLSPAAGGSAVLPLLRQIAFRLAFHPRSWWAATRMGLQKLGNEEATWGYTLHDLSNAQAGVGHALLPRLNAINEQRRAVASRLIAAVQNTATLQTLEIDPAATPIYLRLPLLVRDFDQRELLFARLWSAGIGVGRMYEKTLPAIFAPESQHAYPGAESFARRLLTLPTHYHVTDADLSRMERILSTC
jgi:perosamine synthetase